MPRPRTSPMPSQMEGAGPGRWGCRRFRFLWSVPPSRPLQDCVSVYNIYMYVLFPVLYGPCPLSGRPINAAPRASLPGFLIHGRVMEGGQGCHSAQQSPPTTSVPLPPSIFLRKAQVQTPPLCYHCPHQYPCFFTHSDWATLGFLESSLGASHSFLQGR